MSVAIGKLVKFPVNTLHGIGKQAGTVVDILPGGKVRIKAQLGGYYIIAIQDLIN